MESQNHHEESLDTAKLLEESGSVGGEFDRDGTPFAEKDRGIRDAPSRWRSFGWLRLAVDAVLVVTIVGLLVRLNGSAGKESNGPVPVFPSKTYTFVENPRYLHENMFATEKETLHTLHNWIELSADGRGYVKIENPESFDLPEPYDSPGRHAEPVYMVSVFHQLHCLSYLVQHFSPATGNLTQEVAHHSAHCFDYLRQAIMCNADTSLEGKTETGPGWGSKHTCKDYDKVLDWANSHDVYKWRNSLMPDSSVL